MTPPRVAPAQALDFPDVPDDAPPVQASVEQRIVAGLAQLGKPPRVWARQKFTPGALCACAACKDAEARLIALGSR